MTKKEEKVKLIKVTSTKYYLVPMIDEKMTQINGWDMKTVIKDWFKDYPLYSYHATRDGSSIGHSKKVIDISVMNIEDSELYRDKDEPKDSM